MKIKSKADGKSGNKWVITYFKMTFTYLPCVSSANNRKCLEPKEVQEKTTRNRKKFLHFHRTEISGLPFCCCCQTDQPTAHRRVRCRPTATATHLRWMAIRRVGLRGPCRETTMFHFMKNRVVGSAFSVVFRD